MKLFGLKALRVVALLAFLWLFLEGVRAYYFAPDRLEQFQELGRFFLGPWFALFLAAAGGNHAKRLTEGAAEAARAKLMEAGNGHDPPLQGVVG